MEENNVLECPKCKNILSGDEDFCTKCGFNVKEKNNINAQINLEETKNICAKCGFILADDMDFCPKCGQKFVSQVDKSLDLKTNNFEAMTKNKAFKPLLIGGVIIAIIIFFIALSGGSKDFNKMFSDIANETWCNIAVDGSYMEIDSNPYDFDEYFNRDAYNSIDDINQKLGFSSVLFEKMSKTRAIDGIQSESNKKYIVTWTYHPDRGIEIIYEFNK